MCGILGVVGYSSDDLERYVNLISHRGPDDRGYWRSGDVFFGHCRLAIIDISGGKQPWIEDGKVLIYNGEVYNFLELRRELEGKGEVFRSRSDTEVVFKVLKVYGVDGIKRFNGMFSFGFWDGRRIIIARDRFGIKPLYWTKVGNIFAFSSEIKALISLPFARRSPNLEGLKYHLTFLWCPYPITAFEGINKLPPGYALVYEDGNIEAFPYVSFDRENTIPTPEDILETLRKSVKMHLISDVEVGIFLSGGLDSSAIASLTDKPLRAFSLMFKREDISKDIFSSEFSYAKKVAEIYGHSLEAVEVEFRDEDFERVIYHLEEPVGDGAAISNYLLSREARRRGIKVALVGTGGDELWGGYPRYRALLLSERFPFLRYIPEIPFSSGRLGRLARDINKFKSGLKADYPLRYLLWMSYYHGFKDTFQRFLDDFNDDDRLNSCMLFDIKYFLPEHNLLYTDKTSMAFGLEIRVPMLSNELLKLSLSTPSKLKVSPFTGKIILKEALKKVLPSDILKRKKAGFGAPVKGWISGKLRNRLHRVLEDDLILSILPKFYVEHLINENVKGRGFTYLNMFELLVISTWRRVFRL